MSFPFRADRSASGARLSWVVAVLVLAGVWGCRQSGEGFHATITTAEFDQAVLQSDKLVIVDFGATWCGPCHMMEPVLQDLAKGLEGRAKIESIDVDESPELSQKYNIEAMPTFVFFRDGEEIDRFLGARTLSEMRQLVEAHLAESAPPAS